MNDTQINAAQEAVEKWRNLAGNIPVENYDMGSDNLAIALASYFSGHVDRPHGDEDDPETGWGAWVLQKTNEALDLIVKELYTDPDKLASLRAELDQVKRERDEAVALADASNRNHMDDIKKFVSAVKERNALRAALASSQPQEAQTSGIALIAVERQRQISQEGWTPEHDDEHKEQELARGALAYVKFYVERSWMYADELGLLGGPQNGPGAYRAEQMPDCWPWLSDWWKPTNPTRDLVKAAALLAAEIDRRMRADSQPQEGAAQ